MNEITKEQRMEDFRGIMSLSFLPQTYEYWLELLDRMGFFTAPASTKYHGAYEGGLYDHSENVTRALLGLTEREHLTWERAESPLIVGMFHDLCKCDQYRHPLMEIYADDKQFPDVEKWEYNPDMLLKGHGDKSVMIASTLLTLTEEELLCIRWHMGAFDEKENWNGYTRAIHKYPNVLWTHTADMIAAHIKEV